MYNGLKYFVLAWSYLLVPGLRKYFLISMLTSVALFVGLTYGIIGASDLMAGWLSGLIPWSWSGESVFYQWILRILSVVLLFGVYKYIVLVVLGPVLSMMSEKLEYILSPHKKGRKTPGFLTGMMRGIRLNIFNLIKEMFFTILLFLLSFIPGMVFFTTPAILLVQGYYAGYGVMDFYLERYSDYQTSNKIVFRFKGFAAVSGILFVLLFSIPFFGMVLAPLVGVLAATLFFEKEKVFSY